MDFRTILDKLDEVALSEAISLDDVANAVKGKERDEQARAEILNDLAWKHKLPGLYDPISGNFVGKQSPNYSMGGGGRISIAATGSERSDRALADLGLIPDNAKTSTALGRMFRGDDKGQYDQDLRTRSTGVVNKQKFDKLKTDNLPKLKDLVTQLKAAVEKLKTSTPTSSSGSSGPGTFFGLNTDRLRRESKIYESLLQEFEDEILDTELEEKIEVPPGMEELARIVNNPTDPNFAQNIAKALEKLAGGTTGAGGSTGETPAVPQDVKKIIDDINAILLQFDAMADQLRQDPATQKEIDAVKAEIANAVKAVADKAKADADRARADAEARARADAEKKTATPAGTGNQDPTKGPVDYSLTKTEPEKKYPTDYNKDGTQKSKEERLARMRQLLAKAKQSGGGTGTTTSGSTGQSRVINTRDDFEESYNPESMRDLMARIQRIAEGSYLEEQLTADEYKELQTIAAGLKTEFPDDTEIQTITRQALDLPAVWKSDTKDPNKQTTTTDKKDTPTDKKDTPTDKKDEPVRGQKDPRVQKIQEQLIALGIPLPRFGADGRLGTETENAIKAFQKLAGVKEDGKITPELEKLLADGKNVIARSKLMESMAAVEKILAKYKISESITADDLEMMNEDELRLFVMKNISYLSSADQMSAMKELMTESSLLLEAFKLQGEEWKVISRSPEGGRNPGELILQKVGPSGKPEGKLFTSTSLMQIFKNDAPTQKKLKDLENSVLTQAKKQGARYRIPVTGSERDPIPKGSFSNLVATEKDLDVIRQKQADIEARNRGGRPGGGSDGGRPGGGGGSGGSGSGEESWFKKTAKGIFNKMTGSTKGKIVTGTVTAALALGSLYAAFSDKGAIEMDPADLAELQKHLKVIDEYGKNPEIVKGLPKDVQDRLAKLIKNLEKLKQAKSKATVAAADTPVTDPMGNISSNPAS